MPADRLQALPPLRAPEWVQRIDRLLQSARRDAQEGASQGAGTAAGRAAEALPPAAGLIAESLNGHGTLYEGLFAAPLSPAQADALDHFMQALVRVTQREGPTPPPASMQAPATPRADAGLLPASPAQRDAFSQALAGLIQDLVRGEAAAELRQAFARMAPALASLLPAPMLPPGTLLPPVPPPVRKPARQRSVQQQAPEDHDPDLLALLIRVQQALNEQRPLSAEAMPGRLIDLRA